MRARFKKLLRLSVWAGSLLLVILIGSLSLLHTHWGRSQLLGVLKTQLQKSTGLVLKARAFRYNLLALHFELEGVTVGKAETPDLPPLVQAERIQVQIPYRNLLAVRLAPMQVRVEQLSIGLFRARDGRKNWLSTQQEGALQLPDQLPIDSLAVSQLSISFKEEANSLEIRLPSGPLSLNQNHRAGYPVLQFNGIQPGWIRLRQQSLPFEKLEVQALLPARQLQLESVQVHAGNSTVELQGWWRPSSLTELNLQAKILLDSATISQLTRLPGGLSGRVHGDLQISGNLLSPQVLGHLETSDLRMAKALLSPLTATFNLGFTAEEILLRSLEAEIQSTHLMVQGELAFPETKKFSNVSGGVEGLTSGFLAALWGKSWPGKGHGRIRFDASCPELRWQEGQANLVFAYAGGKGDQKLLSGNLRVQREGQNQHRITLSQLLIPGGNAHGFIMTGGSGGQLDGQFQLEIEDFPVFAGALEGQLGKPAGTFQPLSVNGAIRIDGALGGSLKEPLIKAAIQGSNLSAGRIQDAELEANAEITPSHVRVSDWRGRWKSLEVQGVGEIDLASDGWPLQLKARGTVPSFPRLLEELGITIPLEGTASVEFEASGPVFNPTATLEISAQSLRYAGEPLGCLTGQIRWLDHALVLNRLRLEKPQPGDPGVLEGTGSLRPSSGEYEFRVQANTLHLSDLHLADMPPLHSILQLKAQGHGYLSKPVFKVEATGTETRFGSWNLGLLNFSLELQRDRAIVEALVPRFRLKLTGETGIHAPYPADFRLITDGLDLTKLSLPIGEGEFLGGELRGQVTGRLNGNRPEDVEGELKVETARIDLRGVELKNEVPIRAVLENHRLKLDPVTFLGKNTRFHLSGEFPTQAAGPSGKLQLAGSLGSELIQDLFPDPLPVKLRGMAELDGSIRGNFKDLEASLSVKLSEGKVRVPGITVPLHKVLVHLSRKDDRLELSQFVAETGEGNIRASGMLPVALLRGRAAVNSVNSPPSDEFHFTVDAEQVSVIAASPARSGTLGRFSFRGELHGRELKLPALEAQLEFQEFSLRRDPYQVALARPARLRLSKSRLLVEDFELSGTETHLAVNGTADLQAKGPLNLTLQGQVNAAVAGLFYPVAQAEGLIEIQLNLRGTISDPLISGHAHLQKGTAQWDMPKVVAEDLNVRVDVEGSRFRISELSGTLNGGPISGQGSFSLADRQLREVALNLSGKDIFLDFPAGFESASDLDLEVRSHDQGLRVRGTLKVNEGIFRENIDFLGKGAATQTLGFDWDQGQKPNSAPSNVLLDLKVSTQNPVQVRNNLADLLANFQLNVSGDLSRPSFSGNVRMEEGGRLYFGDRTYAVERGVLTLSPGTRIDPFIDVLATTRVNEYLIQLKLTGTGKNIATSFTSDPALPEDDVLSVLLTGQTMAESRRGKFDPKQVQYMMLMSGALSTDLSAKLRRRFGISQVSIQPDLIASEKDPAARLTVGQDLTRSLRLIYSLNLTDTSKQIWILEYDFQRRFNIRATKQEDNTYRGEFRHDIRFGGKPSVFATSQTGSTKVRRVGAINFAGNHAVSLEELQKAFKLKPG